MSGIKVFGLKNCDKCRLALRKMIDLGFNSELIDVRQIPLTLEKIEEMCDLFGDYILNSRSTTYRGLTPLKNNCLQSRYYKNTQL